MRLVRCRPFSGRLVAVLLLLASLAFLFYTSFKQVNHLLDKADISDRGGGESKAIPFNFGEKQQYQANDEGATCAPLAESAADIDTVATYPTLDFQSLIQSKDSWDKSLEDRYVRLRNSSERPMLQVVVVPHSHNDPGWLRTFEQYFEDNSKNIINNVVQKLQEQPNMTFIWTEISFLSSWWERSHPIKQKALKQLIKEGRLEITTGGWVMPDEACTHIYALIDQFIEGHQWVLNNLNVKPKTGWSVDPFGHGPTVPQLLGRAGLGGAVIQRIHYAWKQWFASRQLEEFHWLPGYADAHEPRDSMLVHNMPFDIYSIKSTCGPHPAICLEYDFRKIPGEFSEYTAKYEPITDKNLHNKAKTLIEEYARIGSLTAHNVVLVPLGDDFRYNYVQEFDGQYDNYMKLFNYINNNTQLFNAHVSFGTPLNYFDAVKRRQKSFATLKGDFFVYSDIYSNGNPAYWSGYFTTRPYIKILSRQLEHQLRTAEILFTLTTNSIKKHTDHKNTAAAKKLERSYQKLITARRNLGLFQHHDAITGTAKAKVMYDYGTRMFTSLYQCIQLQQSALSALMVRGDHRGLSALQSELEWEAYGTPEKKLKVSYLDNKKVVLFNSLIEPRTEVVVLSSSTFKVRILNVMTNEYPPYQISPSVEAKANGQHVISNSSFQLVFVATLPPLTAVTYALEEHHDASNHVTIYCNKCINNNGPDRVFVIKKLIPGDIQLENSVLKLLINRNTGFLRQVFRKDVKKKNVVDLNFKAYQSAQRHSGAYLFQPAYDAPEINILNHYSTWSGQDDNIIIEFGPVTTLMTTLYLPLLMHRLRIFNVDDYALSRGIFIENIVDFENPPKNRETELFMQFQTDIENGNPPVFYTDQNGFQYQKRVKVDEVGIEGNYYPITTMAWIEDSTTRLTLVTAHAQGASAFEAGRLEVMLDRRMLYDDSRGLGEGVVDNQRTRFRHWLLVESAPAAAAAARHHHTTVHNTHTERHFNTPLPNNINSYKLPSQIADYFSRTLNYPINVFISNFNDVSDVNIISHYQFAEDFPTGLHLVALRTINDDALDEFPSESCFMILQRPGYDCVPQFRNNSPSKFSTKSKFTGIEITHVTSVSLTGLDVYESFSSLESIQIDQMDVKTYKLNF